MTSVSPVVSRGMIARIKALILRPSAEWVVIREEPASVRGLFTGYAMILAAIPQVCGFIGGQVFGYGSSILGTYHPSLAKALAQAILGYGMSLLGVLVLAMIVNFLAPRFGGQADRVQAAKVAVYSSTPAWLAGVFGLVPALSFLELVGFYALYLLLTGEREVMRAPRDKLLLYTVVTVIAAMLVMLVFSLIAHGLAAIVG